jgi:hypothetical protein
MPFPSPFSTPDESEGESTFDEWDAFVPEHLPEPGPFLEGHDVLTGEAHVAFRATTREVFEARGVYDATFGYNLARLDLDSRHPDAGYRYAVDRDDPSVLRAEFTPTTAFCPQGDSLAKGSFRAWNGLADEHGYDLVRVRVAPSHDESERINAVLARLEDACRDTGEVDNAPCRDTGEVGNDPGARSRPDDAEGDGGPGTPF